MRLWLAALVLVAAAWPVGGEAQQIPFGAQPAAPKAAKHPAARAKPAEKKAAPAAAPASGKVIKDAAEYNDYISALNITDPGIKAAAMEAFVAKYPGSAVKIDALEQAMAAHQRAGDTAKLEENAASILQLQPDNVRALAIATFLRRGRATQGDAKAPVTPARKRMIPQAMRVMPCIPIRRPPVIWLAELPASAVSRQRYLFPGPGNKSG